MLNLYFVQSPQQQALLKQIELPCQFIDKVGGYVMQGLAAIFVKEIKCNYDSVVGLPLYVTVTLLSQLGVYPFTNQQRVSYEY